MRSDDSSLPHDTGEIQGKNATVGCALELGVSTDISEIRTQHNVDVHATSLCKIVLVL